MKKLAHVIAFAGSLILGTVVSPAMADNYYEALDLGQIKAADACLGTASGCKDTATFFRVVGGYEFTPMWGAEISYGFSGKASLGNISAGMTGKWEASALQLAAIGTFPLGSGFALTGKVGIARTDLKLSAAGPGTSTSLTSTSIKPAFGIGARYDFTNTFGVRAQYEDLGKVGDANVTGSYKMTLISAGIIFKL